MINIRAWFSKALTIAVAISLLSGCVAEGTDTNFPDQDIRMTFLHTTDSHSKILPFKYVPNVWDEKIGILPCDGEAQLADCQRCLSYQDDGSGDPLDPSYIPLDPDPRQCQDCLFFAQAEGICDECFGDDSSQEECFKCIDNVRNSNRCENYTYGGAARVAWAISEERNKALRSAHIDTGDFFQGAPVFNLFYGEPEVRSLTAMGCDIGIIGNHEFDNGAAKLADALYKYAGFPVLNANYMWETPSQPGSRQLANIVNPYAIKDFQGLKIGFIGMGNLHSLNSLGNADNSLGIRAIDTIQTLETYVPMIRHQVDLVVLASHLGLRSDIYAAKNVPGIDIIFGGHDHIIVNPPLEIINPEGKKTLVVHSGVNYKAVGRLDVVVRNREIITHKYKAIPIRSGNDDDGTVLVGEDPLVANILYDYEWELGRAQNFKRVIGTAKQDLPRNAVGDSPLGNLVADAMRARRRVETDFAMTNSLGIRADLPKGEITIEKIYEIFPFENSITTMFMSGPELQRLFDYAASRTAAYGCKTQIQLSGAKVVMDCGSGRTKFLEINGITIIADYKLIEPYIAFSMATNDYIAGGGSGFDILEQNTTQADTMLSLRDVVMEYIEEIGEVTTSSDGRIELIK